MAKRIHIFSVLTLLWLMFAPTITHAQDRCGMVEYEKIRHSKRSKQEREQQFEQWMQEKMVGITSPFRIQASTITIPVVVHIIHNGIADATNISDAQIISQIDVLNKDFNRQNSDASNTPSEFLPVAGSLDIQFVLAKQDPEGLATTGITRTLGTKPLWNISDHAEFKALNYWPAEKYLNIWVVNLASLYIGFAQLPVSTLLLGLEEASMDRLTDGVIIHYRTFGTVDAGSFDLEPQFNKGRTATHEVGHFLGLRHIWGDAAGCVTDYVDDTPPQSSPTSGCPSHPQNSFCGGNKMFQNYLDYSNDVCMNIVTLGQIARMTVVLSNSPRRLSLTTSAGASVPVPVANDLGIRQIVGPTSSACSTPILPQIEVRNYGTNTITTSQIELRIDGLVVETKSFSSMTLSPNQLSILSFNQLTFTPTSGHQVNFQILQTNGTADGSPSNNSLSVQVTVPSLVSLPIVEPFNSTPSNWTILNPDGIITWVNTVAPDNSPTNRAMFINFYNDVNVGTLDWMITPAFNISNLQNALLKFDLAYAQFPGETGDGLKVFALPGCNADLSQAILLYDKSGSALATASSTSNAFLPVNAGQWKKPEIISLSTLPGSTTWQLAFVARNGYGNNLYVDNVVVTENEINDVGLTGIASPGIVHCKANPPIVFNAINFGTSPVTSFQMDYSLNSGNIITQQFNNIQLGIGEQKTFQLNPVSLNSGNNQVTITLSKPNGIPDVASNNTITFTTVLDQSMDTAPLRMTFDNPAETPWTIASPANTRIWESVTTTKEQSLAYRAYTNPQVGTESWLVSPTINLSSASLFFDVSYAQNIPADDRLRILGSDDCGLTYKTLLLDRAASTFGKLNSPAEWFPGTNDDWKREYVSLDQLAGNQNARIAFVVLNNNGNNLFIDNIEVFLGDNTNPPVTPLPYQLYYPNQNSNSDLALTFNLLKKQDVRLQIFSINGQIILDNLLPETLNQTYYFDLSIQPSGLYLFRVYINNQVTSKKVFVSH